MSSKRTFNALVAREVDSHLARKLSNEGYTIQILCSKTEVELRDLGIQDESLPYFLSGRPPVPDAIRLDLMYSAAFTCCVCRDRTRGTIIHHIEHWADSRSHDLSNLILLCLDCHDKAHSQKQISQNLTAEDLKGFRERWFDAVRQKDKSVIETIDPPLLQLPVWDNFNHNRILDVLQIEHSAIDLSSFFEKGKDASFVYRGTLHMYSPYAFFKSCLSNILDAVPYAIVDNHTSRGDLANLLKRKKIILLTANHRFKNTCRKRTEGQGQVRCGYYRRNGIHFHFTVDAWECTSVSARDHVSGQWICTSVQLVRNVTLKQKSLDIESTCLAIGTSIFPFMSKVGFAHNPVRGEKVRRVVS